MENNKRVSEWKNRVKNSNTNLKKLRESSASLERNRLQNFESNSLQANLQSNTMNQCESNIFNSSIAPEEQ